MFKESVKLHLNHLYGEYFTSLQVPSYGFGSRDSDCQKLKRTTDNKRDLY